MEEEEGDEEERKQEELEARPHAWNVQSGRPGEGWTSQCVSSNSCCLQ